IARQPREQRDAHYDRAFFWFNILLFSLAVGITVSVRPVLAVITGPAFHSAAGLVPIILAAYIFQAWSEAAKFQVDMSEKTLYFAKAQWLSVVIIMALYALLIPPFGAAGAAWATLLAFAARQAILHYQTQKLWPISFRWRRLGLLWFLAVAVGAPAMLLPVRGIAPQLVLGTALYGVWLGLLWVVLLEAEEKADLKLALRSPGSALKALAAS
ncbi:MAG TPA: polysaccharide biosynthesis C-terminal domain-containing protein, partial [Gemmatimonadales bacterium]|nr:polysaccharide biosynthesis C-terminal domain-containing protein [Gemmatimonadales bacterium]